MTRTIPPYKLQPGDIITVQSLIEQMEPVGIREETIRQDFSDYNARTLTIAEMEYIPVDGEVASVDITFDNVREVYTLAPDNTLEYVGSTITYGELIRRLAALGDDMMDEFVDPTTLTEIIALG